MDVRIAIRDYMADLILPLVAQAIKNGWDIADTLKNDSELVRTIMLSTDTYHELEADYYKDYEFRDALGNLRFSVEKELECVGEKLQRIYWELG